MQNGNRPPPKARLRALTKHGFPKGAGLTALILSLGFGVAVVQTRPLAETPAVSQNDLASRPENRSRPENLMLRNLRRHPEPHL